MPNSNHGFFYSFDLGAAHFIALSSEFYLYPQIWDGANSDPIQLAFGRFKSLLTINKRVTINWKATANRDKVPWIIVFAHRPMYCTNKGAADNCTQKSDYTFRDGFSNGSFGIEKVLYEYGVDLYFGSHQHVYERFWPIYNHTVHLVFDAFIQLCNCF